MPNKVEIGKMFENRAKQILINEDYEIIEESSKLNWGSPYDFIIKKDNKRYKLEVRGRRGNVNYFSITRKKFESLRLDDTLFLSINDKGYNIINLKELVNNKNKINDHWIFIVDEGKYNLFVEKRYSKYENGVLKCKLKKKGKNGFEIILPSNFVKEKNLKDEDILFIPKEYIKIGRLKMEMVE